jgi:hypothetical protein
VRLTHRAATPGPEAEIVLHRWRTLRRLFFGGDVGFSESYMDGDWDSPNLTALIELGAHNSHNLDNLVQGRTTIAIAHRLSTLRKADRLVVLDRGQVVEVGNHEELMAREGHYYKLYQAQARNPDGDAEVSVSDDEKGD